jgi:hypothetical protein
MTLSGVAFLLLIIFASRVMSTINKYDYVQGFAKLAFRTWNGVCLCTSVHFQMSKCRMHLMSRDKKQRRLRATRTWFAKPTIQVVESRGKNIYHNSLCSVIPSAIAAFCEHVHAMRSSWSSHRQTTKAKGRKSRIWVVPCDPLQLLHSAPTHARTHIYLTFQLTNLAYNILFLIVM